MTETLAIGPYADTDAVALTTDFAAKFIANPAALAALSEAERAGIKAVAYKGHLPFGAAEMDMLPALGVIANYGVGYDAIDVKAASARGIKVTNTPDVLNDDVADVAVGLLLMHGRKMIAASDWARLGQWAEKGEFPLNRKISGGRAGILGLGRIGREIADRLAAFKCEIHYFARSEKETPGWTYHADPVSLAEAVDYLVVATVGGEATKGIVSKEVIDALGPRGILVNISRGTTVDEAALIAALESGALGGAALDVFLNEPKIDPRFYTLPNVTVQPHQGSGTVETRAEMGALQRRNVAAHLGGKPLETPVN